mgnify:CR=1 FL=1
MPIKDSERRKYPPFWELLSAWIRFTRAEGRCECTGDCGIVHGLSFHGGRCERMHGVPIVMYRVHATGAVVLTTAHLDQDPRNNALANLKAMCQDCHLRLDRDQHRRNAQVTAELKMGRRGR